MSIALTLALLYRGRVTYTYARTTALRMRDVTWSNGHALLSELLPMGRCPSTVFLRDIVGTI